jgi:recombination protein RecA
MPLAPARGSGSVLPTGFSSLDKALGIGGLPRGRIVEIFGPASCGKTALALQIVAHLQSSGGAAAWIDAEHAFSAKFAGALRVNIGRLPVVTPDSTEQACEMACRLAESRVLDLIVIDSAAALIPEVEQANIGLHGGGLHSRALGSALRRLAPLAARTGVAIAFLNQIRIRPDAGAGEVETSAGGPPLKLYAAARIALAAAGRSVRFRIVKNNLAAAFASGVLEWVPAGNGDGAARSGFLERP